VHGKIFKLFYSLNKDSIIQVKTSSGMSNKAYTGENITQGSVSAALISSKNLDRGINRYFETRTDVCL
jgi:hypothetical protein